MVQNQSTPHSEINFEHDSKLVSDTNENIIAEKNVNDQEAQTVENDGLLHGIELFLVTLGFTSFQPIYGKLSDIFGRKVTFLFAITIFEVGSLLCGLASNMVTMIIYRAIAGIGGGGIIGLVLIIISDIVSTKDRGKYQGIVGACYGIASVAGPLMGGAFTDHVSWRIDFIGIIVMIASTVCILLSLNWGGSTYPWNSPVIIVLLCVGAVGYIIFGLVENYVAYEPVAPPTQSGINFMPYILGVVAFSILSGQMFSRTDKISFRYVTLFASSLSIIGAGLSTMWNENTGFDKLIGFMIISGAGIGISIQSIILCVQGLVEHKDVASGTTLTLFFRSIGAVFGIALSGTAFNNRLAQELSAIVLPPSFSTQSVYTIELLPPDTKSLVIHAYVSAFQFVFELMILYGALMFISALFMGNSKPKYNEGDEKVAAFE
ncbi:14901_t:CDS:2 [Gigaspora margarita]|uniref:14901_t:CDS:1 n=1 Tax=Gigaspora margarita TaxID=4874 RepID=A0ABN7UGV4_GIGMA|nr:14901_t:CDS:2 [Gigaspora margarita]